MPLKILRTELHRIFVRLLSLPICTINRNRVVFHWTLFTSPGPPLSPKPPIINLAPGLCLNQNPFLSLPPQDEDGDFMLEEDEEPSYGKAAHSAAESTKLAEAQAKMGGGKFLEFCYIIQHTYISQDLEVGSYTTNYTNPAGFALRLVFPTLAKNDSPVTMLPQFLQVLGKKIEFAATAQDSP